MTRYLTGMSSMRTKKTFVVKHLMEVKNNYLRLTNATKKTLEQD
jgi:hypothetical protein